MGSEMCIRDRYIIAQQMADDVLPEKAFTGESSYGAFVDHDYYFLRSSLNWQSEIENSVYPELITVPLGFVTDFASIPRMAWTLVPKDGRHTIPSILHDWLYWEQDDIPSMTRDLADAIYNESMKIVGVKSTYRTVIYNTVKHFGGRAWNQNKKAKASGESRLLAVIPNDANTSWSNWKKKKSNFM